MTSNGAESGTEEDEEMAAEDDDSEGEDDLPMEMVEDAGRSNKVFTFFLINYGFAYYSAFTLFKNRIVQDIDVVTYEYDQPSSNNTYRVAEWCPDDIATFQKYWRGLK